MSHIPRIRTVVTNTNIAFVRNPKLYISPLYNHCSYNYRNFTSFAISNCNCKCNSNLNNTSFTTTVGNPIILSFGSVIK